MAFHGTSYGYSAEVASKHKAKYDPAMESAIKFVFCCTLHSFPSLSLPSFFFFF